MEECRKMSKNTKRIFWKKEEGGGRGDGKTKKMLRNLIMTLNNKEKQKPTSLTYLSQGRVKSAQISPWIPYQRYQMRNLLAQKMEDH